MHTHQIEAHLKRYEDCDAQFKSIVEDILLNGTEYRSAALISKDVLISFDFRKSTRTYVPAIWVDMCRRDLDKWTKCYDLSPDSGYNPRYIMALFKELSVIEWFKKLPTADSEPQAIFKSLLNGRECKYLLEMAKPFLMEKITDESFLLIHNALVNKRFDEALELSKKEFNQRFA